MTYLGLVLDLLRESEPFVISEEVEIAKGKYEKPYTWKGVWRKIKRAYKWQLRKQ